MISPSSSVKDVLQSRSFLRSWLGVPVLVWPAAKCWDCPLSTSIMLHEPLRFWVLFWSFWLVWVAANARVEQKKITMKNAKICLDIEFSFPIFVFKWSLNSTASKFVYIKPPLMIMSSHRWKMDCSCPQSWRGINIVRNRCSLLKGGGLFVWLISGRLKQSLCQNNRIEIANVLSHWFLDEITLPKYVLTG